MCCKFIFPVEFDVAAAVSFPNYLLPVLMKLGTTKSWLNVSSTIPSLVILGASIFVGSKVTKCASMANLAACSAAIYLA